MKDNTNDKSEQKKVTQNRRDLLKKLALSSSALAVGGVLPKDWVRPAVDSVLLPVHAQTSNLLFFGLLQNTLNDNILGEPDSLLAKALDSTVGTAQAQKPQRNHALCVEDLGSSMRVTYQNPNNSKRFQGTLQKNGSEGFLGLVQFVSGCNNWCGSEPVGRPARITAVSATSVTVELPRCEGPSPYSLTVGLAGSCSFPALDGGCRS